MASTDITWWRKCEPPKSTQFLQYNRIVRTQNIPSTPQLNHNKSYGVILCREIDGEIKYGLVKRRTSYGVKYILRGDWNEVYFTELSIQERSSFIKVCLQEEGWEDEFMHLWRENNYGNTISNEYIRSLVSYTRCRNKFVDNREWLLNMFQSATLIFPNGVWEFPKGHMERTDNSSESCALREVEEETGIARHHIKLTNMGIFDETYRSWFASYFVGVVHKDSSLQTQLTGECSEMKWCCFEEAMQLIPSVINERLHILTSVHSKVNWIKRAMKS